MKLIIAIALTSTLCLQAKTWRNADGTKSFEGEFVSRTDKEVTILLSNRKPTTFSLGLLHEDDRFWLDQNHPPKSKSASNPAAIFDQVLFGDNRKQVEEKLKTSKFAKLTVDETFIGRSGLNGIFRTTGKVGELDASLFFDWNDGDSLSELNLHTDPQPINQAKDKLIPCWEKFAHLLSKLYGKPVISSPELNTSSIADGAFQPTHLWHLPAKGSVRLGASRDRDKLLIICRFSEEKINPVEISK